MEELDGYGKQLEEFAGFADLNEVPRYLKKAQALKGITNWFNKISRGVQIGK